MSVESNMMKVDSEKIKEVLRHHNELTQQIHNQVIDIRKKIDEVEQQSLEMASYPKIDLSATGSGSGIHKDLADVYLNYQRLVKTQERELTDEMLTLIASARGIHRLYKLERMQYLINNYPDEFPEIQGGRMVDRLAKKYNLSKSTVGEYLSISKNLGDTAMEAFENRNLQRVEQKAMLIEQITSIRPRQEQRRMKVMDL